MNLGLEMKRVTDTMDLVNAKKVIQEHSVKSVWKATMVFQIVKVCSTLISLTDHTNDNYFICRL